MSDMEKNADEFVIVTPDGDRLDSVNALQFKSRLIDVVNSGNARLALDLSGVDFMDSSGLAVLISCLRTIGDDGEIVLIAPSPKVEKLLVITKLNRVFRTFATKEELRQT